MKDQRLLNHYRNLRTRLLRHCNNKNFVTLVTSVVPDDDTVLISANLGACFALDESKTAMLIEANINQPLINRIFDLEKKSGLIDFLETDDASIGDYLHKTGIPRLRAVPSGRPRENSSEYFTSDKMRSFIEELTSRYPDRFPIINAPSILYSADARILVEMCDQVLLVVPYGKCTEEDIYKSVLTIGQDKLAGLITNNF
jgi:Mrp family chromosome partitioning ATPase